MTQYNGIARKVMEENGVAIDDLHAAALPRLSEIQLKQNVHFTPEGSAELAKTVAASIETALKVTSKRARSAGANPAPDRIDSHFFARSAAS